MNPILSPWFWAVVCVIALAVAFILWEMRRATPVPNEWPELDQWEADTEASMLEALRLVDDADDELAEFEAAVIPFRTDTKDRIAGIIAANRARHLNWDDAFGGDR